MDNSQDGQIMDSVSCIIKGKANSTFQMAHLMSLDELNLISHRDNWDIVPKQARKLQATLPSPKLWITYFLADGGEV